MVGVMRVADIQNRDDLIFVSDSQDVEFISKTFQEEFDAFFVKVANGVYEEIYGIEGTVPYLSKRLWRVL